MIKFYDTCSLLNDYTNLKDVYISSKSIEELEDIKTSSRKDSEVKFKARAVVRAIREQNPYIVLVEKSDYDTVAQMGLEVTNDNLIIASAARMSSGANPVEFYSEDYLCLLIAKTYFKLSVNSVGSPDETEIYKGYKIIHGNSDQINEEIGNIDFKDWYVNEYLIIENTDDNTSKEMRFDGEKFVALKLPPSRFLKGKNSLQRCALDILNNQDITISSILGGYGSGKTYLSMQMALYHIQEKANQSHILGVREVMGEGKEVGFLPGTLEDKTGNFFAPLCHSLAGGEYELERLKMSGVLDTNVPFFMKGTTYNDTIILCDEAEDLSESQIRLIGTRLGDNSKIFFAGDYKQSLIDKSQNNALIRMCNEFKGNPKFACIVLDEDVRSETSKMFADLFQDD